MGAAPADGALCFFVENSEQKIMGWAKTSPKEVLDNAYTQLDFIFVGPEWAGTNALKLLLYGIKETVRAPLIVNSALLQDYQRMMPSFLRDENIFRVRLLNKHTGETREFIELVNDPELCYLLLPTGLGFGQQFMPESVMKFSWYFSLRD